MTQRRFGGEGSQALMKGIEVLSAPDAKERTMMRVIDHLPPVKHKFEVALSKSRGLDRVED